uniref:GP-PDE domain-containing protein n=1 Tax=Nyssomyia neivai TaxID=330878 RepID=A0A1L8DC78_9DIPT
MHRWWFMDDCNKSKENDVATFTAPRSRPIVPRQLDDRKWTYKVHIPVQLDKNEIIAITGDCEQLGNWKPNDIFLMERVEESDIWVAVVDIPSQRIINYRYLICAIDPTTQSVHVRQWETHLIPRSIPAVTDALESFDTFGDYGGLQKIDRGWLTTETIFQFSFYNNPFRLTGKAKNKLIYVKLTPMNLRVSSEAQDIAAVLEESLSNDTRENGTEQPAYAFTECVSLCSDEAKLEPVPQFGRAYHPDDILTFHITVTEPENVAYLIDLYTYSSRACTEEPPRHIGYHYILPNLLKKSEGQLELSVTCASKHRPLGMMRIEYVKISPLNEQKFNLKTSFIRYWNPRWKGLEIGHRGSGTSFKSKDGNLIRENTIASLKNACAHGADMVEFDVQLSKDLVPVIYHDFSVYVCLKRKTQIDTNDMLELPMAELTLEQLHNLKVYHVEEGKSREPRFFDEDLDEHQPFPTLAKALETIDPHVGFNVEVKWSMRYADGTWDINVTTDKNLYVDSILKVVLNHAADRRIVFSCFDPDICTMLRFKQNLYPVMFLTCGDTARYPKYYDPRCNAHSTAIKSACAMELLGIVGNSEDLLKNQESIQQTIDNGLIIFCWGEENNCSNTIRHLKNLGLHAIIYDKMDVFSTKERKESIFLLEARESQKELLKNLHEENKKEILDKLATVAE